jgi:hypothetical protein
MAKARSIHAKVRLTPNQFRTVSDRRFGDAEYLVKSGDKNRANGAIYMAGFVIECLLKALLLERHRNLQVPVDPATLSSSDREVFELLYSHKLENMLGFLPEVESKLSALPIQSGPSAWAKFMTICEEWTVYARYSPNMATLDRARVYVDTIKEVKKWLRGL